MACQFCTMPNGKHESECPYDMGDDLLTKPFKPCVVVLDDPKRTEMVLRDDCLTMWAMDDGIGGAEFGYDAETGELVAIRIYADVAKRKNLYRVR